MIRATLLVCALLLFSKVNATIYDSIAWRWNFELSWDHFKAEPPKYKSLSWNFHSVYSIQNLSTDDQSINPRINIVPYILPETSWIQEHYKTDVNLERIGFGFDLFELGARKGRYRIDSIRNSGGTYRFAEAEDIIELGFDWYDRVLDKLSDDYRFGARKNNHEFWKNKIDSLFNVYKIYNRYVLNDKAKLGSDFDIMIGSNIWLRPYPNLVEQRAAFQASMMWGVLVKDFTIGLKIQYCNSRATPEMKYMLGFDLDEPNHLSIREFHLNLYRRVYSNDKIAIGLGASGGRTTIGSINYSLKGTWSYAPVFILDWSIPKGNNPMYKFRDYGLRFKLEYNSANFTSYYSQRLLVLSVGLFGYGYRSIMGIATTPKKYR